MGIVLKPYTMGKKKIRTCLLLFLLSLIVRSAYLVGVTGIDAPMWGDMAAYHSKAVSLSEGKGLSNDGEWGYSQRPPLTSVLLAGLYTITGPSTESARWFMVFISSISVLFVVLLSQKIYPGKFRYHVIAGLLWTFYPPSIFLSNQILTENMAVLLALLALNAYFFAAERRSRFLAACTGMVWGFAALNRSGFLFLPFVLFVCEFLVRWFKSQKWQWDSRLWVFGLGAFILTMTPWTVRNYAIHGVFMPTTARSGYVMLVCNGTLDNEWIQKGMYYKNIEKLDMVANIARDNPYPSREVASSKAALELTWDEIKEKWHYLPKAVLNRALGFWHWRPNPFLDSWSRNDWIMLFVWGPVLVGFSISFFFRAGRDGWPSLSWILYAFLFTLPFWGTPRFRFPVDALIILQSWLGMREGWDWLRRRYFNRGVKS